MRHRPIRSSERVATAMRLAGNPDVTVAIFPSVSHSLLPDPGGLSSGWASLPGFLVAPPLRNELTSWITAKLKPIGLRAPEPITRNSNFVAMAAILLHLAGTRIVVLGLLGYDSLRTSACAARGSRS